MPPVRPPAERKRAKTGRRANAVTNAYRAVSVKQRELAAKHQECERHLSAIVRILQTILTDKPFAALLSDERLDAIPTCFADVAADLGGDP